MNLERGFGLWAELLQYRGRKGGSGSWEHIKNKSYCNSELGKEKEMEIEAGGDLPRLEAGWALGRGSR